MDNDSGTPLPSGPVHGPSQAPPRLSPARPAVVHGATCVSSRGWKIVAVAAGDSAGGGRLLPGESRTLVLRFRRAQGRAAPGPGESLEAAVDRSRVALASSGATSQLAAVGSATDSVLWCAARCTDARPASWALNLSPFPTRRPPHPPTPCTPPSLGGGAVRPCPAPSRREVAVPALPPASEGAFGLAAAPMPQRDTFWHGTHLILEWTLPAAQDPGKAVPAEEGRLHVCALALGPTASQLDLSAPPSHGPTPSSPSDGGAPGLVPAGGASGSGRRRLSLAGMPSLLQRCVCAAIVGPSQVAHTFGAEAPGVTPSPCLVSVDLVVVNVSADVDVFVRARATDDAHDGAAEHRQGSQGPSLAGADVTWVGLVDVAPFVLRPGARAVHRLQALLTAPGSYDLSPSLALRVARVGTPGEDGHARPFGAEVPADVIPRTVLRVVDSSGAEPM